jgi:hypothetical protein
MKYLIITALFICGQVTAQVPLMLKSKNTDSFKIYAYEVSYYITDQDSVKINGFIHSDLDIKYIDNTTYYAKLDANKWYLLLHVDSKGNKKNLFFQTDILSLNSPLTITADFLSPNNYYMQYDALTKTYKGGILNIPLKN